MAVTIYEVAHKAGVSISTVSRVLNDRGRVSKDTERKVLAAIKELDFHPNINASGLAFQRTNIIGALVFGFGDISIPEMYALEFFTGLQQSSASQGYGLLVVNNLEDCIKLIKNKRMDGLVVHSSQDHEDLRNFVESNNLPVVYVGEMLPDHPPLDVRSDYEEIFRQGFHGFAAEGINKICTIIYADNGRSLQAQLDLIIKISHSLRVNDGIEKNPEAWIVNSAEDPDTVWLRIGERMDEGFRGFFADSFYLGQQTLDAANKKKKIVGRDLFVTCVEYEEDQGNWLHPPVSGVYLPCREMGTEAMNLLIQRINGVAPTDLLLTPTYIKRNSL